MNWLSTQMAMLDAATSAVGFGVNWFLQSTLLLAIGLIVGRLLKQRGSAVQSAVYRMTLIAVLVCPMATWMLSLAGISGWSVEMPQAWTYERMDSPLAAVPDPSMTEPESAAHGAKFSFEPPIAPNGLVAADRPLATEPPPIPGVVAGGIDVSPATPAPLAEISVTVPAETWLFSISRFAVAATAAAVLWTMISTALIWRLATAWRRLARLRRQSTPAKPPTLRVCHELACKLAVPAPDVRRSPYLPSPCLAGIRRPAVLLPEVELSLSIRDVLIHELAHLARHDCLWNLLRRLSAAVFFFQPLIWMLSRQLEMTAEEVCDDYVVHLGGDRAAYAHRLVDIAELSAAPIAAAGVGIVSLRSMLANRVSRIMDTSRSLSTRVGGLILALVLIGGIVGTTTVGLIGVASQSSVAEVHAQTVGQGTRGNHDVSAEADVTGDGGTIDDISNELLESVETKAAATAKSEPEKQKAPTPNPAPKASAEEMGKGSKSAELPSRESSDVATRKFDRSSRTIRGRVTGADGNPAAGAHIAVVAFRMQARRSGDFSPREEVVAEGETDDNGDFRLSIEGVSSKTHYQGDVIARKDGRGIAWKRFDLDAPTVEVSLELPPEVPIAGKLVDIEGQPAPGVRLQARTVMKTASNGVRSNEWVGGYLPEEGEHPTAWLQVVTTDAQGRFTLHGVPAGHGVSLSIAASDRFAPQDIVLNAGIPEQRGERDGTYRSLVRNLAPGEEAILPLAPAQLFEGVVTFEDTGKPAPHARLTIWASQQGHSSMSGVAGKANEKGRYRISAKPGDLFRIDAYPPQGRPYRARTTLLSQSIRWEPGDRVMQVDITLPRGVLVQGKLVEKDSQSPVAGASIMYSSETVNNPNSVPGIVSGSQISAKDGTFEIAVLPGPGRLLVQDPQGKFVLQQIASRQLSRGMPGGERYYAHAIKEIDPDKNSGPIDLTIELSRGTTIRGRIVDELGTPAGKTLLISRLHIFPGELQWRGDVPQIARGGRFELTGLDPGQEHTVHFLDAQNRLGATARLNSDSPNPTVVLQPCGQALVHFVDKDGQPVAEHYPTIEMVVTPGFLGDIGFARKIGALRADADFISNIDRKNYPMRMPLKSDKQGNIHLPALIPGATYRIRVSRYGREWTAKTFQGKANETLDLGDIVVQRRD